MGQLLSRGTHCKVRKSNILYHIAQSLGPGFSFSRPELVLPSCYLEVTLFRQAHAIDTVTDLSLDVN